MYLRKDQAVEVVPAVVGPGHSVDDLALLAHNLRSVHVHYDYWTTLPLPLHLLVLLKEYAHLLPEDSDKNDD